MRPLMTIEGMARVLSASIHVKKNVVLHSRSWLRLAKAKKCAGKAARDINGHSPEVRLLYALAQFSLVTRQNRPFFLTDS